MKLLKTMLCAGIHYLESGLSDFERWSTAMRDEFGEEVEPLLDDLMQNGLVIMYRKAGAQPQKQNCWEFHDCKRHGDGKGSKPYEVCPAATECRLDSIHGGRFGGRACWLVMGTLCGGEVQASPEDKRRHCEACSFTNLVRREEGPDRLVAEENIDLILP